MGSRHAKTAVIGPHGPQEFARDGGIHTHVVLLHGREGLIESLDIRDARLGVGGDAWAGQSKAPGYARNGSLALGVHLHAANAGLGSLLDNLGREGRVELRAY